MDAEHYLAIGKILSPWGLQGEFKFRLYNSNSQVLFETRHVYRKAGFSFLMIPLQSVRRQGKSLRIHLQGVQSPEEAKVLQGEELFLPRAHLPSLEKKECYAFELVGVEVVTVQGEVIGKVREVVHYGASEILVVQGEGGKKDLMIPMVPDFLREVSVSEKKIVVDRIEELI